MGILIVDDEPQVTGRDVIQKPSALTHYHRAIERLHVRKVARRS